MLIRASAFLRPHRLAILGILGVALCIAAFNAVEPLILKRVFDGFDSAQPLKILAYGAGGLVVLGLLRELGTGASNWLTWRTRLKIHYALQESTVERLHTLPLSFHRNEGVGAVMTRLDRGIQGFVGAVSELAFNVVPAVVYLGLSLAVMFRMEWRLALAILAFVPLPALIARRAAPEQIRRERDLMERWVKIYARFNEVLSGIVTVKSFAMEGRERTRFLSDVNDANGVVVRGVGIDAGTGAAQNLVVMLARVAAIGFGGWLITRHQLSVGSLVAFLGYVGGLFGPVQGLSGIYKTLQTASVSLEQVFAILDAPDHLCDLPGAAPAPALTGSIHFDHVSFGYSADAPLLHELDIQVKAGERVAMVGPSGAGKSTLMSLLCRFYDPTSGTVRVDGQDVRHLQQQTLRQQIGVVMQDALLFNESVRDNIGYGKPGAHLDEIVAAAKAANAHEFILKLPQGYDTSVGERGNRLSMGERQRVAIARSLLKNPPILILDEPTSALDAESEALVQEALLHLTRGRTTFAIAHRLSTVIDSDRILVLRGGRIIEEGSHRALMALNGYYASLVRKQTQGLLPPNLSADVEPAAELALVKAG